MSIKGEIEDRVLNKHRYRIGAAAYSQGHWDAKVDMFAIAEKHDKLIARLFDALCDRHADDLVDELKEEFGYDC